MDGSSFMENGRWQAGYTGVTIDKVIEAWALVVGTWAQKAKLIALTRTLELSQGKNVNIYTDSKNAFLVAHAHGAIWKEKGLLTLRNKDIKNAREIFKLLEAGNLTNQIAIMHCPRHQKNHSQTNQGNQTANEAERRLWLKYARKHIWNRTRHFLLPCSRLG